MADSIPTKEKLALALEALGDRKLKHVIRRAREGYYHDFESPLPFPEIELYNEMYARGYLNFCERVKAGEFDASSEESSNWVNSLDGMETLDDPKIVAQAKALIKELSINKMNQTEEEFEKDWKKFIGKGQPESS